MADWVDNYYDPATFDTDGVSMGCRVELPQPMQKTASDRLHFSWKVSFVEDGEVQFDELSMHMDGVDDG
jgi:hypothetical protein